MIAREREYERVQQKLYEEFKQLDINQDGSITLDEIVQFLHSKSGQQVDTRLAEEIFAEIDKDQSGRVSLVEFVEAYFAQQMEVEERIEELKKMIDEDQKKRVEIAAKLQEISGQEQMNGYGIMVGSVLTATIVEARELRSGRYTGTPNPYVVLQIEGQKSATDPVPKTVDPVFNEIISFDIVTGRESLIVQVFDHADIGSDTLIGQCEVTWDELID
jgi:hypothetical protein